MDHIGIERMRFEPETAPPRWRGPWSMAFAALTLLGIGAVSPAAVNILRWRDGAADAHAIASDRNATEASQINACTVLHRHAQESIESLIQIAARGGEPAKHAEILLRKLSDQAKR